MPGDSGETAQGTAPGAGVWQPDELLVRFMKISLWFFGILISLMVAGIIAVATQPQLVTTSAFGRGIIAWSLTLLTCLATIVWAVLNEHPSFIGYCGVWLLIIATVAEIADIAVSEYASYFSVKLLIADSFLLTIFAVSNVSFAIMVLGALMMVAQTIWDRLAKRRYASLGENRE